MASLSILLSYILRTTWAICLMGIRLTGVERGVSASSVHKKEMNIGIFWQAIALVFEKDWIFSRMPHGCTRTVGMGTRRKGLQIFRKDLAGVHLG